VRGDKLDCVLSLNPESEKVKATVSELFSADFRLKLDKFRAETPVKDVRIGKIYQRHPPPTKRGERRSMIHKLIGPTINTTPRRTSNKTRAIDVPDMANSQPPLIIPPLIKMWTGWDLNPGPPARQAGIEDIGTVPPIFSSRLNYRPTTPLVMLLALKLKTDVGLKKKEDRGGAETSRNLGSFTMEPLV